ncbi:MAG TPA: hemolysin family protein [candidate division Zixibacteria bacterium]|nr:hemolysin family protein [candidate division Zixibacteria bacterium]
MLDFVSIVVIILAYVSGYVVSMYALAVYVDPDELKTLIPRSNSSQQSFLKKLADDPRSLVKLADIYKSFLLIVISVLAVEQLQKVVPMDGILSWVINLGVLLVLWLAFVLAVEVLPRYSTRNAINTGMFRYLWILYLVYLVFLPILKLYQSALNRSPAGEKISEEDKEEIVERAIATVAERAGIGEAIVDDEEREMISQIFLLDQTVVREIMIPRINIVAIDKGMSFRKIRELVTRDGHSRYPVFEETIDKIQGLIYVKDLFNKMPEPGETFDISRYLRKPYFVPETKIIGELLREFRAKRQHIALVVDEYGGVSGLVTLEDIIEEIFGEIRDEHDWEEEEITSLGSGEYLVDANVLVERLQDELDTDYDQSDYDTVGGLIYDLVGSVPNVGQIIRWNDLEFEIDKVEGQRILSVKVRRKD